MEKKIERTSGIELLKLVAMFLIVVSHVVQTYGTEHSILNLSNIYFGNIEACSANFTNIILSIFKYFGAIGNDIFFVSTAWFLLNSKNIKFRKIIHIIIDIWIVSMIFLIAILMLDIRILPGDFIKSIFPTITSANWYMTCYILFYLFHNLINKLINNLSQKEFLRINLILIIIYTIVCSLDADLLYFNYLIQFIVIYFIVGYMKKYMAKYSDNKRINSLIFTLCTIALLILIIFTNYIGLKFAFLNNSILLWSKGNNILIIGMAVSIFNLCKSNKKLNYTINAWSNLTMLIYIIHENILFRTYIRPYVFVYLYNHFGYSFIVIKILIISLLLFIISSIISYIYKISLQKITKIISARIENVFKKAYLKIEKRLLKIEYQ